MSGKKNFGDYSAMMSVGPAMMSVGGE